MTSRQTPDTPTPAHRVRFFDYSAVFCPYERELTPLITDVLRRGAFILQEELREFEANLASFVGARHVIGVANGTDAMVIALHAAGIGAGDQVILPSHTYVATAASVHFVGATPILVECGDDHLIDCEAVLAAVAAETRAIMPVHLNGRVCDMDALSKIAVDHDIVIIEDAAQGVGARFRGQHAGTFGLGGTFSFYPAKTLGCFGDGGAIVTNDDDFAEQVRRLRDHGRNDTGDVVGWGLNSRLDNLQAAILDVKLKSLQDDIERRRAIAKAYQRGLSGMTRMVLPPGPDSDPDRFDAFQNYEVEADLRDDLKAYLSANGVDTIIQWAGTAVHQMASLNFDVKLPRTDSLFERCLLLPMRPSLSDTDVQAVCDMIHAFYGER